MFRTGKLGGETSPKVLISVFAVVVGGGVLTCRGDDRLARGDDSGVRRPRGATMADKMLLKGAATAAEMERDLIRERTLDGLRAAEAQGPRGGRPPTMDKDILAAAQTRQAQGESVTVVAQRLDVGRSTLYRALQQLTDDVLVNADRESAS